MLPSRSPLFAAVLVIGCEAPPEVDRTAARLAPPPPTLRLEVTPLEAGAAATLTVTGARPFAPVRLASSAAGLGDGACPAALGGACLGLLPRVVTQATLAADAQGSVVFSYTPGPALGGRTVGLQAVSAAPGDVADLSNPVAAHVYTTLPGLAEDRDADGISLGDGDCDDDDPTVRPGAADLVGDGRDLNCDGHDGVDADGDQSADLGSGGSDCDDGRAEVYPGAPERCDGLDNDCTQGVDDLFPDHDGSGVADCREAAVLVTWGYTLRNIPFYDCEGSSMQARELAEVEALLAEAGLLFTRLDEDEFDGVTTDLSGFALVIVANGGWADAVRPGTVDALLTAGARPLMFMGDDLAFSAQNTLTDYGRGELLELARIEQFLDNGGPPNRGLGAELVNPDHPIVQGPFGTVPSFDYASDFDHVQLSAAPHEVLFLKQTVGTPALWVYDDGQRRVSLFQPNVYVNNRCPVASPAGVETIGTLFKNTVSWLVSAP